MTHYDLQQIIWVIYGLYGMVLEKGSDFVFILRWMLLESQMLRD